MRNIKFITVAANSLAEKYGPKGASITTEFNPSVSFYVINGTAVLTDNLTLEPDSKTSYGNGVEFIFKYTADVDLNGNTFTIFGKDIPARLSDKNMLIYCTFEGSTWDVVFLPSLFDNVAVVATGNIEDDAITTAKIATGAVSSTEIASNAVTAAKIADGVITPSKLTAASNEYLFPVPVHFDYSAKDNYHTVIDQDCTIVSLTAVVSGVAIDGSNAATMTITNGGATMLSGATLFPAGTSEAVNTTTTLATNNTVSGTNTLTFTPDGSATSGKLFIVLLLRKA